MGVSSLIFISWVTGGTFSVLCAETEAFAGLLTVKLNIPDFYPVKKVRQRGRLGTQNSHTKKSHVDLMGTWCKSSFWAGGAGSPLVMRSVVWSLAPFCSVDASLKEWIPKAHYKALRPIKVEKRYINAVHLLFFIFVSSDFYCYKYISYLTPRVIVVSWTPTCLLRDTVAISV